MKKKLVTFIAIIAIMVCVASPVIAAPKLVGVIPTADENGNVAIPPLPAGAKLVNVEVYDDLRGTPPKRIGPQQSFKLLPGQGFNFLWQDGEGTWYQLITPTSPAGGSLRIDPWKDPKDGGIKVQVHFPGAIASNAGDPRPRTLS